jgi:LuxR family maltose regulon positive regulatory protein
MVAATSFLTTKLYIPPPRPNLVERRHLTKRLNEGLRSGHKLTLVSAPAGFGKTTLVANWVCNSAREVAWLSLDESDNDPVQFFTYLIAALQQSDGNIGRTIQPLLRSTGVTQTSTQPSPSGLITPLINDIVAAGLPITLVLDDYHFISSPAIHKALGFLLKHQPQVLHVVISTREDLPHTLPLPRMRARGLVTEVRERDLRFNTEEIAAFLNQSLDTNLSAQSVKALETRTEGWVAGLQLAALALQEGQEDADTFITAFTGDDHHIISYLVAEVLHQQPAAVRSFLRQTAVLEQLTAPLCDALTEGTDSRQMLDRLDGANLLIPLDNQREWYRYHRLFVETLRTTLRPDEKKALHQKAMHWYETQGSTEQAVEHALAAEDFDDAERLIKQVAEEIMQGGNILKVHHWLETLPDKRVRADGILAFYKGWTSAMTGELTVAQDYVDLAETSFLQTETTDADWGKLLVFRSLIAVLVARDYQRGIETATKALQMLGPNRSNWRVVALWTMAESLERTQNITQTIDVLRQAQQAGMALGEHIFAVVIEGALAKALNDHGRRHQAVQVCQEAIDRFTDGGKRTSLLVGHLFTWMGILAHEANQLEQAHEYHKKAIALNEQVGLEYDLTSSRGLAAPTLYALGEVDAALKALQDMYQNVLRIGYSDPNWFLAQEAHIQLRQGNLPFALRWVERTGLSPDNEPEALDIKSYLVYGHVLLAQNKLADAQRWLERLAKFTEENGLERWLISVRIQQALVAERTEKRPAARDYIEQAVKTAAREDYLRAFLDEDTQVLALLHTVRPAAPTFIDQILNHARKAGMAQVTPHPSLIEPLSERETEVLNLIAAGLTNREIAERLFIAIGTVKRHTNTIYGKLDVHSRTQAVAQAQELGILTL